MTGASIRHRHAEEREIAVPPLRRPLLWSITYADVASRPTGRSGNRRSLVTPRRFRDFHRSVTSGGVATGSSVPSRRNFGDVMS